MCFVRENSLAKDCLAPAPASAGGAAAGGGAKACYGCGGKGHLKADCPTLNANTGPKTCYSCQQVGHVSPNNPRPILLRDRVWIADLTLVLLSLLCFRGIQIARDCSQAQVEPGTMAEAPGTNATAALTA